MPHVQGMSVDSMGDVGWRQSGVVAVSMQRSPEKSLAQLKSLIAALHTRNEEARMQITHKIRRLVEELKKGSPDEFNRLMQEVNQVIFKLVQEEPLDLWTGIGAIGALLEAFDPTAAQLAQLGNYTRLALRNADHNTIIPATKVLGRLAKKGGVLTAEHIEREAKRALETLSEKDNRDNLKLHSSVLVINELAANVPALFFPYVEKCIQPIWVAIRDKDQMIREAGAGTLHTILDMLSTRANSHSNAQWYQYVWEQCIVGLKARDAALNHGALLCVGDVFNNTGPFLFDRYIETFKAVDALRDNSQLHVRLGVLRVIPMMAQYAKGEFRTSFLAGALKYLYSAAKRESREERIAALNALSELSCIMGANAWKSHGSEAMDAVGDVIERKNRFIPEALPCYARLAAVTPSVQKRVAEYVQVLFVNGVSLQLAEALEILVRAFPALKSFVQTRLLDALLRTLSGQGSQPENAERPRSDDVALKILRTFDFHPHDMGPVVRDYIIRFLDDESPAVRKEAAMTCAAIVVPHPYREQLEEQAMHRMSVMAGPGNAPFVDNMSQTMHVGNSSNLFEATLGFNFNQLNVFGRRSRAPSTGPMPIRLFGLGPHRSRYRTASHVDYMLPREEVAQDGFDTSSEWRWGDHVVPATTRGHKGILVSEVVERLLAIAAADPDMSIRMAIYYSLDGRFAHHLATPDSLRFLFMSMNDEVFGIRLLVTETVARLVRLNPSHVLPCIRKQLIQLVSIIEHSVSHKALEESLQLLTKLITAAPQVIGLYTKAIVDTFQLRMHEIINDTDVAVAFLNCLSALAEAICEGLLPHLPTFLPFVVSLLKDRSSPAKLEASLRALGSMIQFTGYAIKPYEEYTHLLPTLFSILKANADGASQAHQKTTKRAAIKVLGVLGALDPYRWKMIVVKAKESQSGVARPTVGGDKGDRALAMKAGQNYTTRVVLKNLVAIMCDPSLQSYHKSVVQVLVNTCRAIGSANLQQFLAVVLPPFITMLRERGPQESDMNTTKYLLGQLCALIPLVGSNVLPYLPEFYELITMFFNKPATLPAVLRFMNELAVACPGDFKAYLPPLLPRLLMLMQSETQSDRHVTVRCLSILYSLGPHLNEFLSQILPALMEIASHEGSEVPHQHEIRTISLKLIRALGKSLYLEEHASAIIHPLLRLMRQESSSHELRSDVMGIFCLVAYQLGSDFAVYIPIVHKSISAISAEDKMYLVYHRIQDSILKNHPFPQFSSIDMPAEELRSLHEQLTLPVEEGLEGMSSTTTTGPNGSALGATDANSSGASEKLENLQVNQKAVLRAVTEASSVATRDGWVKWLRSFALELLQQSPHIALRLSANLASQYQPFTRELFNTAFVSVWDQLRDRTQEQVRNELERLFKNSTLPSEVLGVLLNLLEFMDANDMSMQIDPLFLSDLAAKTSALAKTLRWKEIAFQHAPQVNTEGLVTLYNQLGHADSGLGLLHVAEQSIDSTKREAWYERLGKWDLAIDSLHRERDILLEFSGGDRSEKLSEIELRIMRCLYELGEWRQLNDMSKACWHSHTASAQARNEHDQDEEEEGESLHHAIAPLATAAAWRMGDWTFMAETVEKLPSNSYDHYFHKAVLSLKETDDRTCRWAIDSARDSLAQELTSLVSESYERTYECLIKSQQLAEIEEIQLARSGFSDLAHVVKKSWLTRLKGSANTVHFWDGLLQVRTLLLKPTDDINTWLKFVGLCRNQGQHKLEKKTLLLLLGHSHDEGFDAGLLADDLDAYNPRVSFAYFKHLWAVGDRKAAYENLQTLATSLKLRGGFAPPADGAPPPQLHVSGGGGGASGKTVHIRSPVHHTASSAKGAAAEKDTSQRHYEELLARCFLKLGDWTTELDLPDALTTSTEYYRDAMSHHHGWYRSWHAWALASQKQAQNSADGSSEQIEFITAAIRGYVQSIVLGPSHASVLQDVLRLLTLWFLHGRHQRVEAAVKEGFEQIKLDVWLLVIPQIIARVNTPESRIASLVGNLLGRIGQEFPQELVYALTVCTNTTNTTKVGATSSVKKSAATKVLGLMREHSAALVEQCEFVSKELIRVAISWHEIWHEGIEEASKLFFGTHDVEGMLRALFPLHTLMKQTETLSEVSFLQTYGRDLEESLEWCRNYLETGDEQSIHQAWEAYYITYKRIRKTLQKDFTILELQHCSPLLFKARDLDITLPGLPHSQTAIRIKAFHPQLDVMLSKQRPRRMSIHGSDGLEYKFLLKGHEDLRLDERVMQLFGLVNALIQSDSATAMKTALQIQRYPVIPLNSNVGLIGWVDECDTFHSLVMDFRSKKRMQPNVEFRHMMQLCSQHDNAYDILPLINKVELFEYAMDSTTGQDLYKVLWLQSGTAETWLEHRTTYTLSLAAMSMVGYVLGLGDRHPNNLMLQRVTGKVVHIDFGDCFEVAMLRDKFPEKIPFRLTRMLRSAMEVIGIEGVFRHTCNHVMRVLREHKGSVMAMLEAFVHDPLLQWRILRNPGEQKEGEGKAKGDDEAEKEAAMRQNMILEYLNVERERERAMNPDTVMPPRKDRAADERELLAASMMYSQAAGATVVTAGTATAAAAPGGAQHKGVQLLKRIDDKLNGKDFDPCPGKDEGLDVKAQVDKLIDQATRVENLCNSYMGWCPFW